MERYIIVDQGEETGATFNSVSKAIAYAADNKFDVYDTENKIIIYSGYYDTLTI